MSWVLAQEPFPSGLAWMCHQEESSVRGGILADEMGMGKTIQANRHARCTCVSVQTQKTKGIVCQRVWLLEQTHTNTHTHTDALKAEQPPAEHDFVLYFLSGGFLSARSVRKLRPSAYCWRGPSRAPAWWCAPWRRCSSGSKRSHLGQSIGPMPLLPDIQWCFCSCFFSGASSFSGSLKDHDRNRCPLVLPWQLRGEAVHWQSFLPLVVQGEGFERLS